MLVRVLYVSKIKPAMSAGDIERLAANARRRNRQLDLTGALLVSDGYFVQALEGHELAVEEMMRKIARDTRHEELRLHQRVAITKRLFAEWDMAFIQDSRCDADVRDLMADRTSADEFLAALVVWMDQSKSGPY